MKSTSMLASVLVPLIIYPYVTRVLHAEGIGKVNFAQSVIYYFTMIAQLGIPTYGIREVAKCRDDRIKLCSTVKEILIINIITSIISYVLFFVCLLTVPQMRNEKSLFIIMSLSTLFQVIGVEWLYSGLEKYDRLMISSIIFKILMVIGTFLLIKNEQDYVWYGAMLVLGTSGYGIVNFLFVSSVVDLNQRTKFEIKKHIKPIIVFFAMSVAVTIYTQMDSVMLGFISGTTENGYYDSAVKIKLILISFITSLGTVIMPRASYFLKQNDYTSFDEMASKAMNFVVALSLPFCIYCILMAEPIIMLLSGEGFVNSITPMKLIMPTIVLVGISNIVGIQVMVPLGKEKEVLIAEIIGAMINLIINSLLIPTMGASGAAIGTVVAEIAVLATECTYMKNYLKVLFKDVEFVRIIIALIAAAAVCLCLYVVISDFNYFMILLITGISFFGIYSIIVAPKIIRSLHNI